jgi:hypothetical protein
VGRRFFLIERRAEVPTQDRLEGAAVRLQLDAADQDMGGAKRNGCVQAVMTRESVAQAMGLPGIMNMKLSGLLVRHQIDARKVERPRLAELNERESLAENTGSTRRFAQVGVAFYMYSVTHSMVS